MLDKLSHFGGVDMDNLYKKKCTYSIKI